jgi:hypothetical protein
LLDGALVTALGMQVVALSATGCYQPASGGSYHLRCHQGLRRVSQSRGVITKSSLVLRADVLGQLAAYGAAHVCCSITTPGHRTADGATRAHPAKRLEAIAGLAAASASRSAGRSSSQVSLTPGSPHPRRRGGPGRQRRVVLVRLAKPIDELFVRWLDEHFPDRNASSSPHQDTRGGTGGLAGDAQRGQRVRRADRRALRLRGQSTASTAAPAPRRRLPATTTGASN